MDKDRQLARERLALGLRRRVPTWAVAADIAPLRIVPPNSKLARELVELATVPSWTGREMNDDFDRAIPAVRQLNTFRELFPEIETNVSPDDPRALAPLIFAALEELGAGDYRSAAHALIARRALPREDYSRKRLTKRLRFLRNFEERLAKLADVQRLRRAQMQAKSRLAHEINPDACDDRTLAYCAYLAARANRRSMFVLGSQSRAVDTIVQGLETILEQNPGTNWSQVALVRPTPAVISRLDQEERGKLIGRFHAAMADAADALSGLWAHLPERMRAEMVMVRDVDSSRWNAYAGALNTMRSAWISAVVAAGYDGWFDRYCPGKAPRLMASDLVWWYRRSGGDLHEDTRMFAELPHPWDVVTGRSSLTRKEIRSAAKKVGIEPDKSGWIGPRAPQAAETPQPEPALVHGIAVADAGLAVVLRRCGAFSGQTLRYLDDLPDLDRGYLLDVENDRVVPIVASTHERVETSR